MMADKPDGVMTITELAEHLKVSRSTSHRLTQGCKTAGQKVGFHWLCRKETVDQWLDRISRTPSTNPKTRGETGGF